MLLLCGNHTKQEESRYLDQLYNAIHYQYNYKYKTYVEMLPADPLTQYIDTDRSRLSPLRLETGTLSVLRKIRLCYLKIWSKY